MLMLVVAHLLNLATAELNSDIDTFLKPDSKFGLYMPILFSARLILFSIFLFLYHFS